MGRGHARGDKGTANVSARIFPSKISQGPGLCGVPSFWANFTNRRMSDDVISAWAGALSSARSRLTTRCRERAVRAAASGGGTAPGGSCFISTSRACKLYWGAHFNDEITIRSVLQALLDLYFNLR